MTAEIRHLQLGSCPDSWGVWFADDPRQTPWQRFLDELAAAGYRWLELGPYGYLPTDPARLTDELRRTRARGYAIDNVENEDGVRCVAAPVRDHAGAVVASLSVAAPAYRFDRGDLPAVAPRVMAAAAELSARLGHKRRPEGEDG
jgi:inosose dehydratase